MDAVKTYQHVNREDKNLDFSIFRMETVYAERQGQTDAPHRHNYYTCLFTQKAQGKHIIDFNAYELGPKQSYFIAPGQVHQIIEEQASVGYGLLFSDQFLASNNIRMDFIESLQLFNEFGENPPIQFEQNTRNKIFSYLEEIDRLYHSHQAFKEEAISALLKLVLIESKNACQLPKEALHTNDSIVQQFKKLIQQNYKEWHSTSSYANALHITPDHLNRIVKAQSGKTAKAHIQNRITVAAKRLLYFSNLSLKEIAYELGFSEPANFSAFFKHCEGISPSGFKDKH